MKRRIAVLFLCLAAVLLVGCGGSGSEAEAPAASHVQDNGLPAVTDGFSFWISNSPDGRICITFDPWSPGVEGDGFIVRYNNIDYFLPEGEKIFLRTDRQYVLFFTRAFLTEKGYVMGSSAMTRINFDEPADYHDTLYLQPPSNGYYSWLIPPEISANFQNGTITVAVSYYQTPPQHLDDIEVVFSGFIRAAVAPAYLYIAISAPVSIAIPPGNFIYATARGRIKDLPNNRVIVGSSAFLKFIE